MIRAVAAGDHDGWAPLWDAYLRFYRTRLAEGVTQGLWQRLLDPAVDLHGLIAVSEERVVGLAHYLFHPGTWSLAPICYLEDLFVAP